MDNAYEGVMQWVAQARAMGLSDVQISEQLTTQGWQPDQVRKILTPVSSTPVPLVTTTTPIESVRAEMQSAFDPSVKPKTTSWPMRHLVLLVSVLGGLIICGGVAYAAWQGIIPVPFMQLNGEKVLSQTLTALETVKSGEVTLDIAVGTQGTSKSTQDVQATKNAAQDSTSDANAGQLRTGLAIYYDEHNTFPSTLDGLISPKLIISEIPKQPAGYEITYAPTKDLQDYALTYKCATGSTSTGSIHGQSGDTIKCAAQDTSSSSDIFSTLGLDGVLSADATLTGKLASFFSTDSTDIAKLRGTLKVQGSYVSGGTTYAADLEARIVDRKMYLIANTLPSFPFMDTSTLTKKWYVIGQDLTQPYYDSLNKDNVAQQDIQISRHEAMVLLQLGITTKALVVGKVSRENLDSGAAQKVPVTFDFTKFSELAKAYKADATKRSVKSDIVNAIVDGLTFDPSIEKTSTTPTFTLTIWSSTANHMFRKAELAISAPIDAAAPAKGTVHMNFGVTLAHVNDQPTVTEPTGATPITDALQTLFGSQQTTTQSPETIPTS